ncbi:MAG TPA: hypothetical protein VHQ65_03275 [Thermoanaerobaculia bacterium]|nr:hypothetical protein [Thermoanaerobaculia bacterium]
MANDWVKHINWAKLMANAPEILRQAREVAAAMRDARPAAGAATGGAAGAAASAETAREQRLGELSERLDRLERANREQARLDEEMAEQLQGLTAKLGEVHRRLGLIAALLAGTALVAVAALVAALVG